MGKYLLMIALVLAYSTASSAADEGESYGGIQYAAASFDPDDGEELEPTALIFRAGKYLTENFAVEGRIARGIDDDSDNSGAFDSEVEVENIGGVYGVFRSGEISGASFYGVLGYSKVDVEISALGVTDDTDERGFSYGVGVNVGGFSLEYMSYIESHDFDFSAVGLGFVIEF